MEGKLVISYSEYIKCNWLLPLIILIGFPKLFGPLSTVTLFAPEIGQLLFLIPLLFLIVGVVRLCKVTKIVKKVFINDVIVMFFSAVKYLELDQRMYGIP
ncbi:hypothetical protein [Bacillus toyonensis]|uniref:hypothetical protein n=1 Tax=Bacillus toyonensis TaxID=155322 RepID=UPI0020D21E1D|nr:hypothetical protein [Bacillus toyonensis]MDF9451305.1 hypothetical protein [Bacillus toyonensis]MDG1562852.1 hypothetical protein [Bacillus toyonensis]